MHLPILTVASCGAALQLAEAATEPREASPSAPQITSAGSRPSTAGPAANFTNILRGRPRHSCRGWEAQKPEASNAVDIELTAV